MKKSLLITFFCLLLLNCISCQCTTNNLSIPGYRLVFTEDHPGAGLILRIENEAGKAVFINSTPAMLTIVNGGTGETQYQQPYQSQRQGASGQIILSAKLTTNAGSIISVEDTYDTVNNAAFRVSRNLTVIRQGSGDTAFRSRYSIASAGDNAGIDAYEYFIPSILYRDTACMTPYALASHLKVPHVYIKETRSGLPLAMLREKASGNTVTLAHYKPQISVNGIYGGGKNGTADTKLQYGSIGYGFQDSVSVDYCYPCLESPDTYSAESKSVYHPVMEGVRQNYNLCIIPMNTNLYTDAMRESFQTVYTVNEPKIAENIDLQQIYNDHIKLFTETFKQYGTGKVRASGVPWSIELARDGKIGYTFQMGFVGQQTSVGFHMIRTGYRTNNPRLIEQGKAIIDFWTSDTILHDALPIVWWDPGDNDTAGQSRGYPSFLRCFADGMEGILDAYAESAAHGADQPQWKNALLKVADFLVSRQNDDGSFYRVYNPDGSICADTGDNRLQGTSKLNTPIAIRFLVRMYGLTGRESYKKAALRAAEFSYRTLYQEMGKYVGGTPDNPNTVDKEAAIFAMYAFNAVYGLTGDKRWLLAAEHAGTSAMSWVYCYDFACPAAEKDAAVNVFAKGGISGFSVIATGHSGADNYDAFTYFELFKLYVFTGKEFYRNAALFIQNNTKLSIDKDGIFGYRYRAMGPEATNVADFRFQTVGVWLPWSGIANIKPMVYMESVFGTSDIARINKPLNELRAMLASHKNSFPY